MIGILLLTNSMVFGQVLRDSSYTLERTIEKVQKKYPHLKVQGVYPNSPSSVESTFNVDYKDLGYRKLPANLFIPKTKSKDIGVLLIHGGGWRTGYPGLMTPIAERLADEGYYVVVPEYRMSLEAPYPAALEDLKDALEWMRLRFADSGVKRLVVMGCSAGGQLATLIGTTTDNVAAIIDIDGVLAFKHPVSEEGSMAAQWLGGTYEEVPEIWEEASALSHVSNTTPTTLFLASKYPRFLAGREEYMDVLKKAGTFTEVRYLEDAPHSFWLLSPWFEPTINYVIQFLNNQLDN